MAQVMVPALALWRRSAVVVAVIILTLISTIASVDAPASQAFIEFNHQRVREFRDRHDPKHPHTLRVVMLGNSRLKNATIDAEQPALSATDPRPERIESFRLVANWAVFRNFEPLLDEIRGLRADVYVIQMDLLVEEMAPSFQHQLAFRYLRWLTAGKGVWTWYEPKKEQLDLVCTNESEPEMRATRAETKLIVDPSAASPQMAQDFIAAVTAAGARVLLVSVPKSEPFERIMPSVSPTMIATARQIANSTPGVTIAAYPNALPIDHFCDVTHLNREGAAAYSRWLVDRLSSVRLASGP
jgi:hypothetical protein